MTWVLPNKKREWRPWESTALWVALGPFVLGVWLSLDTSNIRNSLGRLIFGPRSGPIDVSTAIFVGLSAAWTWMLYLRLRDDDKIEEDRRHNLMMAVTGVPVADVFVGYGNRFLPDCFRIFDEMYSAMDGEPKIVVKALESGLRDILQHIAELAAAFPQSSEKERRTYGANIMLVAAPDPSLPNRFPDELVQSLRFNGAHGVAGLRAMLYLPSELLVRSLDGQVAKDVPVISLPIPWDPELRGYDMTLPGAPRALVSGEPNAYSDTRLLASEHCSALSQPVIDEVAEFFSDRGDGKDILSFASFRIGDGEQPVGVLNIDAKRLNLLGEPAAHATFYALLVPVIRLLAWPVSEYARLRSTTADLYGETAAEEGSPKLAG